MNKKELEEVGKTQLAQRHQRTAVQDQMEKASEAVNELGEVNDHNLSELDRLLQKAEGLCEERGLQSEDDTPTDEKQGEFSIELTDEEKEQIKVPYFTVLGTIDAEDQSWDRYMEEVHRYASENHVDLTKDPFDELLTEQEKGDIARRIKEDYTMEKAHCDKYDYLIAGFSGVATGLIDCFFVGMPKSSKLGNWADKKADQFVEKMAQGIWNADSRSTSEGKPRKMPKDLHKSISYLEQKFLVNYDARYAKDLNVESGVLDGMYSKNHHLKSLSHAPNIIGLIFSILDQFTQQASFVDQGKIIRIETNYDRRKLVGANFRAKLFCGCSNWIGHLLSDLVGSSSTRNIKRGKTGRGSGIGIPFYELFQFCHFGKFEVRGETFNFAELSVKVFERGYDLRFGATMAIPVVINELLIRLLWAVKQRYYHEKDWKACIPFGQKPELRRMLLVGHGCLCLVDGIDATVRSGGKILNFALHLNLIAWSRFAFSGLIEIRALYKENALDLNAMDQDLEREWRRLSVEI